MDKLKPCPFCGCTDRRVSIRRQGQNGYRAICGRCGATGPYVKIDAFDGIKLAAQEHAIKLWGQRVKQSGKPMTPEELQGGDREPVRCVDCRYLDIAICYGVCGRGYLGIVNPWDYCSHGKRKDDTNNDD